MRAGTLTNRQEQSQECFEHHMLLKGHLDKINHFLFGDTEHGGEVSFVSKVNLMFDELKFIKQCLICSIATIFTAGVFLGQQLRQINISSQSLNTYMEQQQQIELRLVKLEAKMEGVNR